MWGRFLFWSIVAWSLCGSPLAQARINRDAERSRAIDQMEKRLQATAAAKRSPLPTTRFSGASSSSPAQAVAAASSKAAPNLFERIFGKPAVAPEGPLRPVSGKSSRTVAKTKAPVDSARPETAKDGGGSIAWDTGAGNPLRGVAIPEATAAAPGGADFRQFVGSLLSHMAPVSGGGSDGAMMEAGSYRLEDFAYEQRKRSLEPARTGGVSGGIGGGLSTAPPASSKRLIELLAHEGGQEIPEAPVAAPEDRREKATAMLGEVAGEAAQLAGTPANPGSPAAGGAAKEPPPGEGPSAFYKRAYAKLQTYDVPALPPLRAVSGFQGLMTAKPSEQTVEGNRAGVLSALQLK